MSRLIDADDLKNFFEGYSCTENPNPHFPLDMVKMDIDKAPTVEAVPKSYAEQIRWERDVAVRQLNEIGCQFGQKMDEVKDKLNSAKNWIPCSERLPAQPGNNPVFESKPLELYLISVKNSDYPYRAFWNGKIFTDGFGKVDAIAWMPLPEAYKGEQHETD